LSHAGLNKFKNYRFRAKKKPLLRRGYPARQMQAGGR